MKVAKRAIVEDRIASDVRECIRGRDVASAPTDHCYKFTLEIQSVGYARTDDRSEMRNGARREPRKKSGIVGLLVVGLRRVVTVVEADAGRRR